MENYYQVLGVAYDATNEDIKKTYKLKAKEYHPDVSKIPNASEIFKKINHAKDILIDPQKRLQHDYAIGIKVNTNANNGYNNNPYENYNQPPQQQETGNNGWWVLLIIFIIALLFGSSNNDKNRRY
jgi:DnaJ-class molecular chaperone